MERREHTETYRGHELTITAWQQRANAWSWTYLIDGTIEGHSAVRANLPDAESALRRGTMAARLAADGI